MYLPPCCSKSACLRFFFLCGTQKDTILKSQITIFFFFFTVKSRVPLKMNSIPVWNDLRVNK